jgi:hypothetical protein
MMPAISDQDMTAMLTDESRVRSLYFLKSFIGISLKKKEKKKM